MSRALRTPTRRKRPHDFPPELRSDWGARVLKRRKELGFTQESFAALIGVDQSTVSRLERGELFATDQLKWVVAGALRKTIGDLFPHPNTTPPFPERAAS